MKYRVSYVIKDGTRIENQIYTAEHITKLLLNLEAWGCTNIVIESFTE